MDPQPPPVNPQPPHYPPPKKTSTLKIVLWIVIPIVVLGIGGMMVASFYAMKAVSKQAYKAQAQQQVQNLVSSVQLFDTMYGVLPFPDGYSEEDIPTDNKFIDVLTGTDLDRNPKGTGFLEGRIARAERDGLPRRGGFVEEEGEESYSMVDPWGNLYVLRLDADGDGLIEVPGEGRPVQRSVVCWSYGKPPDESNYKSALQNDPSDWIKSWD